MEFKSFSDVSPAESISFLGYGAAGSGKTEFAGSAGERTLYIDVGKSAETFHGTGFKQRKGAFNGLYIAISEDSPAKNSLVPDKALGFDRVCDAIDEGLDKYSDRFDTIVLDEVTAFRKFAMLKGMEVGKAMERSKAIDAARRNDMIIPGVQDYGAEMSLIEQFTATYIDLCKRAGKHFIMLAHERLTYRKGDKPGDTPTLIKTSPGFTGQTFPDAVANLFDMVWHFEVINSTVFRARTIGNDSLVAKTRYGGIFGEFESNPNWLDIVKRIREQIPLTKKK